jgi:hypothetical protein
MHLTQQNASQEEGPNPKFQAPKKSQAPILKITYANLWDLVIGISLEIGF